MMMFAVTALEKLKAEPPLFWGKLALVVVGLVVLILVIRKLMEANKVVLTMVALIIGTVLGVNWIYDRNEPAFMTPIVEKIAPFFPAKDSYGGKQKKPSKVTP